MIRDRAAEAFQDKCLITLKNPKAGESEPPKNFSFDSVFAADVKQKYIYDTCAFSMVESVLNGYNGTFFAYGQVTSLLFFSFRSSFSHSVPLHFIILDWGREGTQLIIRTKS